MLRHTHATALARAGWTGAEIAAGSGTGTPAAPMSTFTWRTTTWSGGWPPPST
jgi:hypothetical protein